MRGEGLESRSTPELFAARCYRPCELPFNYVCQAILPVQPERVIRDNRYCSHAPHEKPFNSKIVFQGSAGTGDGVILTQRGKRSL